VRDSHINIFDTHGIFHKDFPLNGVVILWIHEFLINILAVDIFSEEISKFLSSETRREHDRGGRSHLEIAPAVSVK
jgi:hypothetical protein